MGPGKSIEGERIDREKKMIRMRPWGTSTSRIRYATRRQGALEGTAIEEETQVSVAFQKPIGNKNVPS